MRATAAHARAQNLTAQRPSRLSSFADAVSMLDAAVDAGFAEGHVLFSSEMSRRLRVPDRVPVDSMTLAMIALSK